MIIESIVRLGKPFLAGDFMPAEILKLVSDGQNPAARNFYTKVITVEIDHRSGQIRAGWDRWGIFVPDDKGRNEVFAPDLDRAVAAPFVLPAGGNPLKPQGKYGVPAYLLYEKHFHRMREEVGEIRSFLQGRLIRTPSLQLTENEVDQTVEQVREVLHTIETQSRERWLGLLVLLHLGDGGIYRYEQDTYTPREGWEVSLGSSRIHAGLQVVADLTRIVEQFWESKLAEAEEKGILRGGDAICSICGQTGHIVSAYSKSWNWYTPTWRAPFSIFVKEKELVEGIGLCPHCYQSLTFGGNLFSRLTATLPNWLTKEIFAPVDIPKAKNERRQVQSIYGGVMVLPLLDEAKGQELVRGILRLMETAADAQSGAGELHLSTVTGLEMMLPPELAKDRYRLQMIYFSGDPSRGDIHLRAAIEDVMPSAVASVTEWIEDTSIASYELQEQLFQKPLEPNQLRPYQSLPVLLSRAYGPSRMWGALAKVMHRQPLDERLFVHNAARRLSELTSKVEDHHWAILHEVFFYLYFRDFLRRYREGIGEGGKGVQSMRHWQKMLQLLQSQQPQNMHIQNVEELGFAIGYLVRVYERMYYTQTRRNYLQDRIITFGSRLTPQRIVDYGLKRMVELSYKLKFHERFRFEEPLLGLLLAEYQERKEEIQQRRDDFMTSFWAGYCLHSPARKGETAGGQIQSVQEG